MAKSSKSKRYVFFALWLFSLYVVHLTLFEALMFGSCQISNNLVHFTFDRNSQTDNTHPSVAADYQRLLKHEDGKKHTFVYEPCKLLISLVHAVPCVQRAQQPVAYSSPKAFHLPDEAFRRYSLFNVFLI
jgi:hypothetical protein